METNPTTESMKRGEFLRSLGLSSAALMAFYCMGTSLTACSSKSTDPTPSTSGTGSTPTTSTGITGNADTAKGAIDFTLDLTDVNYKTLTTIGNYVYVNNIVVARINGGNYVALSKVCTHEGTTIEYRLGEDDFYCPNHGSRYTDTGSVKNGPSTKAVQQFKTTPSTDGKQLRVTA